MITESTIYWILKLDDIRGICVLICILSGLILFGGIICYLGLVTNGESPSKEYKSVFFKAFYVLILGIVIGSFLPSTRQMAMIKVIPMIANSEVVGEMSADAKEIYKLGINAIKESLGGLSK